MGISTELILNASQQDELVAISRSRSLPAGYVFRAKVERDVIARGIFTSVKDLAGKFRRYSNACSANAKPIQWKYSDPARRLHALDLLVAGKLPPNLPAAGASRRAQL